MKSITTTTMHELSAEERQHLIKMLTEGHTVMLTMQPPHWYAAEDKAELRAIFYSFDGNMAKQDAAYFRVTGE